MDWRERLSPWTQEVQRPESLVLVAERVTTCGPELVGFANAGTARDDDLATGAAELYAIYLNPDAWGTGTGSALLQGVIGAMKMESWSELVLWVLKGNDRAIRFYEHHSFQHDGPAACGRLQHGGAGCTLSRFLGQSRAA
jgi:L-amino acid N-acyltransferase YncA